MEQKNKKNHKEHRDELAELFQRPNDLWKRAKNRPARRLRYSLC